MPSRPSSVVRTASIFHLKAWLHNKFSNMEFCPTDPYCIYIVVMSQYQMAKRFVHSNSFVEYRRFTCNILFYQWWDATRSICLYCALDPVADSVFEVTGAIFCRIAPPWAFFLKPFLKAIPGFFWISNCIPHWAFFPWSHYKSLYLEF